MHVVLTQTELPRLRSLGYEVFAPPYLSKVYDQSANRNWDAKQPTSLPPEIFEKLSKYRFFYRSIEPEIAEILNTYFDTVVVTISTQWLRPILETFKGKIIYRVFGQIEVLSNQLFNSGKFRAIQERENFWFVPHCEESVTEEHSWLKERMKTAPYTLPYDVFTVKDTWAGEPDRWPEIMASCPNIYNVFFKEHYRYLNERFPEKFIKLYGVQPKPVSDFRLIGTIKREKLFNAYQKSAGYLYTYKEPNVCYLPPIEMMTIGGPVLYLPGSLLAKYFGKSGSPGLCRTEFDAKKNMRRILTGDQRYISEVIASQSEVRKRYDPQHVYPIFDQVFREILSSNDDRPRSPAIQDLRVARTGGETEKTVALLFHFPISVLRFKDGQYLSGDGIPRVMRKFLEAILEKTSRLVFITCLYNDVQEVYGFFNVGQHLERVKIVVADPQELKRIEKVASLSVLVQWPKRARNLSAKILVKTGQLKREGFARFSVQSRLLAKKTVSWFFRGFSFASFGQCLTSVMRVLMGLVALPFLLLTAILLVLRKIFVRLGSVLYVRADQLGCFLAYYLSRLIRDKRRFSFARSLGRAKDIETVVVPHYYWFPESVFIQRKKMILYLPDYMPHVFKAKFDGNKDRRHALVGRLIAAKSKIVFTNSKFTESYLPESPIAVKPSKIRVFPLPLLMPKAQIASAGELDRVTQSLAHVKYLFYPTQNRPNKNLDFLLKVFAEVRRRFPDLRLVLTCRITDRPETVEAFEELGLQPYVYFFQDSTDAELAWLYQNAVGCSFTTTMEGNFPPQVLEALHFQVPIVAVRFPLITEFLGPLSDSLLLCNELDPVEYVEKTVFALENRAVVLERQKAVYQKILNDEGSEKFASEVARMLQDVGNLG
jgi:glycosyltransferase involved in cell wall biosynthesis